MEINKLGKTILGVVPTANIVEGRFGLLCAHTHTYDFGSKEDLPGIRVPATAEEAKRARYIVTWALDNRPTPIYNTYPAYTWALRYGFDQTTNVPFSATVYLTHQANQNCLTIPSGTPCLAFADGIFTVASGCYVYDANLENPGAPVIVANTAEDGAGSAGKPMYQATMDERVVGRVVYFNPSNSYLTIETID